ncbi:DnaJ-domain-containing protein [Neolentinus lepideus HHB14362 ss-1]|uniref:DnaJ-domain-containing protein n=1 Tax=Neolentinus lepideus HHB14362 ss-1 TaxID=1314782 RepID=A0A165UFR5_9AGAM|nr:DnaJ-domain-containing protein [Neolentinus lepideus HHB14362 ss-1]
MSAATRPKFHYYSTLNLPPSASDHEIRERYRALSIVFHPDKQHDEQSKDIASKTFLEIQKAYEVLSDPFLRAVYDVLGEEGLSVEWSDSWKSRPIEQVRTDLKRGWIDSEQMESDSLAQVRGTVTCGIDATTLFDDDPEYYSPQLHHRLMERLSFLRTTNFATKYSLKKQINEKTRIILTTNVSPISGLRTSYKISGTVRHQFSPRLTVVSTLSPLRTPAIDIRSTYQTDRDSISVTTSLLLNRLFVFIPPLYPPFRVTIARSLSKKRPLQGVINFSTGVSPSFSVDIVSPSFFDWRPTPVLAEESDHGDVKPATLSSGSPFSLGTAYRSVGFAIDGIMTRLKSEVGINFEELALQLKMAAQLGITGLTGLVGGVWTSSTGSEVAAFVQLSMNGVHLRLEFLYMGQRLVVPVFLAPEYDPTLALCSAAVPSTAFALGYYFVLRPKRIQQRRQLIRQARREVEDSVVRRENDAVQFMLKDAASRHLQTEAKINGLIITEAIYGVEEVDEESKDLSIDVTIPLQALTQNSQLYIPNRGSKASLQGFFDPCPLLPKVLRIRYTFGGRMHYAEIPDGVPVAIPLEDHLVE